MAWVPVPPPVTDGANIFRLHPVTSWTKTFRVIPVKTIDGNSSIGILYKRTYKNYYGDTKVLYAKNEFEILKYEEN